MSCKKPEVAQGLGRMKTERDRRIVASIEARRRKMLRAMTKVRVKMGYGMGWKSTLKKGKNEQKESEKKGSANVKRCKNLFEEKGKKGAHM